MSKPVSKKITNTSEFSKTLICQLIFRLNVSVSQLSSFWNSDSIKSLLSKLDAKHYDVYFYLDFHIAGACLKRQLVYEASKARSRTGGN